MPERKSDVGLRMIFVHMMSLLPTLSLKLNEGNVGGGSLSNQAHADQIKKGRCDGLVRARLECESGGLEHQSSQRTAISGYAGQKIRKVKKASIIVGERSFHEPIKVYHTSPWVENCSVEVGETAWLGCAFPPNQGRFSSSC